MEFTVNQVSKDKISGYLSVPKVSCDARTGLGQLELSETRPSGKSAKTGVLKRGALFSYLSAFFKARIFRVRNRLASAGKLIVRRFSLFVQLHFTLGGLAAPALPLLRDVTLIV